MPRDGCGWDTPGEGNVVDQLEIAQDPAEGWGAPIAATDHLTFTAEPAEFGSALRLLPSEAQRSQAPGAPIELRVRTLPTARGLWMRFFKTALDKLGALVAIIIIAPVLVAVALAIKLTTPGPVFYRQTRVGIGGRYFRCLKFRTMVVDADKRREEILHRNEADGLLFKIKDDPRVTPVGRWLRRLSLDELPQLFHVLSGRMSLVGPRPALPIEVDAYDDVVRGRLAVKPGLTGLWQVSGRSDLSWADAVKLDLYYVEHVSLRLDVMIILRTIPAVLFARGAY